MPTTVPLLDLQAQYGPLREEILAAVTRVCDSQRFIMGPEITSLEQEMAAMLGVRHAVAVSSGTDALLLALMALGISAGDEVVTPTARRETAKGLAVGSASFRARGPCSDGNGLDIGAAARSVG